MKNPTVRAWSYTTKRASRAAADSFDRRLRDVRATASFLAFSRLEGGREPNCVALLASEKDIDRLVSMLSPGGKPLELRQREIDAIIKRREVMEERYGPNTSVVTRTRGTLFPDGEIVYDQEAT